jgi:hypothetical protein
MTSHAPRPVEPREVELKLGLPSAAEHARLREALDAAGGFVRAVRQENLFLDGTHDELSNARVALRVRTEHDDGLAAVLLTLKAGGTSADDVADRPEWECPLPLDAEAVQRDPSRLLALDLEPVREVLRRVPGVAGLRSLGGFSNDRRVYRVPLDLPAIAFPAARIETDWELDRTEFPDGSVDHELEVELGHLVYPRAIPGTDPEAAVSMSSRPDPPDLPQRPAIAAVIAAVRSELDRLGIATVSQPKSKYDRFRERMLS